MYKLRITRKDGTINEHFFADYDSLDYNATFCQFSSNIVHAEGLKLTISGWKELFKIG